MNIDELNSLLFNSEVLLSKVTKVLDENPQTISGKLRIKLALAELNLYKINQLLRESDVFCDRRV